MSLADFALYAGVGRKTTMGDGDDCRISEGEKIVMDESDYIPISPLSTITPTVPTVVGECSLSGISR
jgi:hypothetical protein